MPGDPILDRESTKRSSLEPSREQEVVGLSVTDGIAWLTLKRPEVLNAINSAITHQLAAHLTELRERDDVRVVVTQGEGRAFCAGSDLREIGPLSPDEAGAAEREQGDTFTLLDHLPQPTIAALHGHVLGGGVGLAVYHDFRIASASATLGLPEVELGWPPPWALSRLVDVVGAANARWLVMACKRVTSDEAKELGLVNEVVPDEQLAERVEALARGLAAMPPDGVRRTKALITRMSPLRDPQWDAIATVEFERSYGTPEAQENVAAFLARRKRKPG